MVVFVDIIADMISNKKRNPILAELFIRGRKLNISLAFLTKSYFAIPWNLFMKVPNKRELQQIALNYSSNIEFQDFISLYKKFTGKPYFFWLWILLLHQIILHVSEKPF